MRVLIQAQTNPKHQYGYNLELAYEENDVLPWSDKGILKGCKKEDIIFIIMKFNGENKVMYKCIIIEDNVDVSTTIDDSKYYFAKTAREENAKNRTGTCLLLKKLQYIDDDRLYMKALKAQGLIKRDYEQNHTTDKKAEKVAFFNCLDEVFDEYLDDECIRDIQNDFDKIELESSNIEEKYRKDFIKTRIGQGKFRDMLIEKHGCKCAICNLGIKELLIASHIKEFAECQNGEHIDVSNGLLLCANHDKLFDKHLITFDKLGKIQISKMITPDDYNKLNIGNETKIDNRYYNDQYMEFHRKKLR